MKWNSRSPPLLDRHMMATPLFPTFDKRISDAVNALIAAQITPWSFLTAGPLFQVKRFDGREISYQGVTFDGSPHEVFWSGYIEPFLEDLVVNELAFAVGSCKEHKVDARQALPELQGLLLSGCIKIFAQMAEVDRRLRGKGNPESVSLRSVKSEQDQMAAFIQTHVSATLGLWDSSVSADRPSEGKDSWINSWHKRNPGKAWAMGNPVAIVALIIAGLGLWYKLQGKPQAPATNTPTAPTLQKQVAPPTASTKLTHGGGTGKAANKIDPASREKKMDLIVQKKEAWLKAHPGLVARYRAGKADKVEIETAIEELQLIKDLAEQIDDRIDSDWADQRMIPLQMIDTPSLRQGERKPTIKVLKPQ